VPRDGTEERDAGKGEEGKEEEKNGVLTLARAGCSEVGEL
jgi:hypothetical protein